MGLRNLSQQPSSRLLLLLLIGVVAASPADCVDGGQLRAAYSYQFPVGGVPPAMHQHQQCPSGAPLQWRPYLDASSKAYLAPAVVIATLKEFSLSPIQLNSPLQNYHHHQQQQQHQQQHQQQQTTYHPQDINNAGVNIYATFNRLSVHKSRLANISSTIRLVYRVSASLSTTTDLMQLAKSNTLSPASSLIQTPTTNSATIVQNRFGQRLQLQAVGGKLAPSAVDVTLADQQQHVCALELGEQELEKKVNKLFKKNQNYILFLDQKQHQQQQSSSAHQYHYQQQQQQQSFYYPFATHEPLNNQTSRALRRILCKKCGK